MTCHRARESSVQSRVKLDLRHQAVLQPIRTELAYLLNELIEILKTIQSLQSEKSENVNLNEVQTKYEEPISFAHCLLAHIM